MLQTHQLTLTHQTDLRTLVHQLDLSISKGDKVALIGEEGNGKSSLLKTLISPELVADYIHLSGQIHRSFRSYVYIPQSLPLEMAELTLSDYFFGNWEEEINYALLYRYAEELHFDSQRFDSSQQLASLSGGEKLKVQFIKLLSQNADILFLDEPSNDLDMATLIWLEQFIQKSSQTIVFVSHDETFLSKTANKIVHLQSVKKKEIAQTTVATADYQDYHDKKEQAYQKQVHQARNEQKEFNRTMEKHLRQKNQVRNTLLQTHDATAGRLIAKKMKSVLSKEKRYLKEKEELTKVPYHEDEIAIFFEGVQPLASKKQLLSLENTPLYQGEKELVSSLNLRLYAQDKIGIIGANGVGKSSLLKELYMILQKRKDLQLGYLPQNYYDLLDPHLTPLNFLSQRNEMVPQQEILTHLASLRFTKEEVHHAIAHLSGGQCAKILLLKMVLDKANFLLLDEPSRNFSPTSQPYLRRILKEYTGGLVCISHDRRLLSEVCQRIYQLSETGLHEVSLADEEDSINRFF